MSVWNAPRTRDQKPGQADPRELRSKVTIPGLLERKHHAQKIAAVTAYDFPSARLAEAAGVDLVLVGDSLAMTMLGHDSTLAVTVDEMLVFTRAVRRGLDAALLVADLPFGSYQASGRDALRNAIRFVKEAGAQAVKLEGAKTSLVSRLVDAEIPVMGHLGLTPQSIHRMGGYRVQARSGEAIAQLHAEAHALAAAGCFSLVLEGIPREVAANLTGELSVPTIGIGAGPDCDGQILVWHDLLAIGEHVPARFVRQYAQVGVTMRDALARYVHDVREGVFPDDRESYHLPREEQAQTDARHKADRVHAEANAPVSVSS